MLIVGMFINMIKCMICDVFVAWWVVWLLKWDFVYESTTSVPYQHLFLHGICIYGTMQELVTLNQLS
jgi:hypothetical protein